MQERRCTVGFGAGGGLEVAFLGDFLKAVGWFGCMRDSIVYPLFWQIIRIGHEKLDIFKNLKNWKH